MPHQPGARRCRASTWRSCQKEQHAAGEHRCRAEQVRNEYLTAPTHLRDRHRPGSENWRYKSIRTATPAAGVSQRYLPDGLERGCFLESSDRGWEDLPQRHVRAPRPSGFRRKPHVAREGNRLSTPVPNLGGEKVDLDTVYHQRCSCYSYASETGGIRWISTKFSA